jgi:hypothetical protein
MDQAVTIHAQDLGVVCTVMDLAQAKAVRNLWPSALVPVWQDVGRVKQLTMAKSAHCTLRSVRRDDQLPKAPLMQPKLHVPGCIRAFERSATNQAGLSSLYQT